jgi:alanine racemase
MPRPISATINLAALAHNLGVARRHAGASRIWAVLKANAYGHGLVRTSGALSKADGFAVLDLSEARALRSMHPRHPVLLLEGVFRADDIAIASQHDLSIVVHHEEQIAMLKAAAPRHPLAVYLKMNSGMNRLGFTPVRYKKAYHMLQSLPCIRSISLMTHFADADGPSGVDAQLQVFNATTMGLAGERSVANSAALLRFPGCGLDWVRPGIMLYGCTPFGDQSAADLGLLPAMTLASEIIATQQLSPGDSVGYGRSFVADRAMRIGVIACGYGDGYPRHAPSGTPVLVGGRRTQTVGRVSMDILIADLTLLPDAKVGTPVTLWGEGLSADEVAQAAGTIGYELVCALAARVPIIERQ